VILQVLPDSAVFDSNILIDFLNGQPDAFRTFAMVKERYISVVARAEVLSGARDPHSMATAHRLLGQCRMIDVDSVIADTCAALRQRSRLKLPDALIGATALVLELPLLSRDEGMIDAGIGAIIPYRLD
jgi:predicted nucleic acid-binding protein